MTYNSPILVNVDTAFRVVLGVNPLSQEVDHSTENSCDVIDGLSTEAGGSCPA